PQTGIVGLLKGARGREVDGAAEDVAGDRVGVALERVVAKGPLQPRYRPSGIIVAAGRHDRATEIVSLPSSSTATLRRRTRRSRTTPSTPIRGTNWTVSPTPKSSTPAPVTGISSG